ncbi:hypothetical protein [Streptomyces sp. NPDC001286]
MSTARSEPRRRRTPPGRRLGQVLELGHKSGEFTLIGDACALGRSFVAIEDGYAMDLLVGDATAQGIEDRLLDHARIVTGNPAFGRSG